MGVSVWGMMGLVGGSVLRPTNHHDHGRIARLGADEAEDKLAAVAFDGALVEAWDILIGKDEVRAGSVDGGAEAVEAAAADDGEFEVRGLESWGKLARDEGCGGLSGGEGAWGGHAGRGRGP